MYTAFTYPSDENARNRVHVMVRFPDRKKSLEYFCCLSVVRLLKVIASHQTRVGNGIVLVNEQIDARLCVFEFLLNSTEQAVHTL